MGIDRIKKFFQKEQVYKQLKIMTSYLIPHKSNIKFKLNIGGGSFTDGETIVVGLPEIFQDKSEAEIFVALKALVGHECQHINSSDFFIFKKFQDEVAEELYKEKINKSFGYKIAKHIFNSVEDGRIEKILASNFKGYQKYLKYLNGELWKSQEVRGYSELQDFLHAIVSIAVTGLKPKGFDKYYKGTRVEEQIDKTIPLIINGINARTCHDCYIVCKEIFKINKDYIVDLLKDIDKNTEGFLQNISADAEYTTSEEKEYNDNPEVSNHFKDANRNRKSQNDKHDNTEQKNNEKEDNEQDNEQKDNEYRNNKQESGEQEDNEQGDNKQENNEHGDSEQEDNGQGGNKQEDDRQGDNGEDEKGNSKEKEDNNNDNENATNNINEETLPPGKFQNNETDEAYNEEDDETLVERTLDEVEEIIDEAEKALTEEKSTKEKDTNVISTNLTEEIKELRKKYSKDSCNKFKEIKIEFEEINDLPIDLKRKGMVLRKEIEEIFENKKTYNSKNVKKGILDVNNLWKLSIKDNNIFMKKGRPNMSDYCVFLLQDGSGSMSSDYKEVYSMQSLAILEEALKGIVPFKISTFATEYYSDTVVHYTAKEFDEKKQFNYAFNFFKYRRASGGNKDGYSIRVATKELLKRNEKDKVLIVLSDGLPSDYIYGYEEGIKDVKDAVNEARKNGIIVISIIFGTKEFRESAIESYKFMYGNNIVSCDPQDIPKQLSKLMKKLLKR